MRRIVLLGELGGLFGKDWELVVRTPAEALRAINANRPGFIDYLTRNDTQNYRITLDDEEIGSDRLVGPYGRETLYIAPVMDGSGSGTGKAIIGGLTLVAAIVLAVPTGGASVEVESGSMGGILAEGTAATSLGSMIGLTGSQLLLAGMTGAALMFTGISMLLAPNKTTKDNSSYMFGGPDNTAAEGSTIPVGYGRLTIGSVVISSGIDTLDIPIYL